MNNKNVPRDVLNTVNKATGKKITQGDIQKLASGVKPTTMQSETQLRQLIKSVAKMANVPVSDATVQEIIKAVKSSGVKPDNIEKLVKMMTKK